MRTPAVDLSRAVSTAPRPPTQDEIQVLWADLGAEDASLSEQAGGIEGVMTEKMWCPNCGGIVPSRHSCYGNSTMAGDPEAYVDIKYLLKVATGMVLCLFLIVDLTSD